MTQQQISLPTNTSGLDVYNEFMRHLTSGARHGSNPNTGDVRITLMMTIGCGLHAPSVSIYHQITRAFATHAMKAIGVEFEFCFGEPTHFAVKWESKPKQT